MRKILHINFLLEPMHKAFSEKKMLLQELDAYLANIEAFHLKIYGRVKRHSIEINISIVQK